MKGLAVAAALAVAVVLASPVRADFEAGLEAYYNEDFTTAVSELRPLAQAGDPAAQYRLGMMTDYGQGLDKNPAEAARWLRLAAVQGHADGQFALAMAYINGHGVKRSQREGRWWLRQAANQGHQGAQDWLVGVEGGRMR